MKYSILLSSVVSALVALTIAFGVAVLIYPAGAVAQDRLVAAEEVVVVDANGTPRLVLHSGPGIGAGVDLLATDGTRRLLLQTGGIRGASPDGVSLNIHRSDGSRVIRFGIEQEHLGGRLILEDEQGRARLALAIEPDGSPSITMWDADGGVSWSAP